MTFQKSETFQKIHIQLAVQDDQNDFQHSSLEVRGGGRGEGDIYALRMLSKRPQRMNDNHSNVTRHHENKTEHHHQMPMFKAKSNKHAVYIKTDQNLSPAVCRFRSKAQWNGMHLINSPLFILLYYA